MVLICLLKLAFLESLILDVWIETSDDYYYMTYSNDYRIELLSLCKNYNNLDFIIISLGQEYEKICWWIRTECIIWDEKMIIWNKKRI